MFKGMQMPLKRSSRRLRHLAAHTERLQQGWPARSLRRRQHTPLIKETIRYPSLPKGSDVNLQLSAFHAIAATR
ncbi:hypothetical protein DIE11_24705 [Burkholderia sp. Bp9012]|nr:hypothetical protein DIE11_24705 [Burkholderia sp. Bp9012]